MGRILLEQLLSEEGTWLVLVVRNTDFAKAERYCTQMQAYCGSFSKFTVFIKSIFTSRTDIGSPKQILTWPLKSWGTNVEIVSFGNVLRLFISLRPRGNTSHQHGLSNILWIFFSLLISVVNIYCAALDTNILAIKKEPVCFMSSVCSWSATVGKL